MVVSFLCYFCDKIANLKHPQTTCWAANKRRTSDIVRQRIPYMSAVNISAVGRKFFLPTEYMERISEKNDQMVSTAQLFKC